MTKVSKIIRSMKGGVYNDYFLATNWLRVWGIEKERSYLIGFHLIS